MKINQGCKTKERCEITSNPPNRPIWLVDDQLWFADAAFCISKHPTSVKNNLHFRTFLLKALRNPNKCFTFAAPEPAKPLNDAQMSGSFFVFIGIWQQKIPFPKTVICYLLFVPQKIHLWKLSTVNCNAWD